MGAVDARARPDVGPETAAPGEWFRLSFLFLDLGKIRPAGGPKVSKITWWLLLSPFRNQHKYL